MGTTQSIRHQIMNLTALESFPLLLPQIHHIYIYKYTEETLILSGPAYFERKRKFIHLSKNDSALSDVSKFAHRKASKA